MTSTQIILMIIGIVVVAALVLMAIRAQRSRRLREHFGPEYKRVVTESGSAARGEEQLAKLERRVERFKIRPLSATDRTRFAEAWRAIQAKFVDSPELALEDGDRLVREVMNARGYPVENFEQQAADLSVNHPFVVEHYRACHEIAMRHAAGKAGTEDLRQGMLHCRTLFEDLVGAVDTERARAAAV
jgi:hypothetical protein